MLIPISAFAEHKEGTIAIHSYDFSKDLLESNQLVGQQKAEEEFKTGVRYYQGAGVARYLAEAFRHFKNSAEQGYIYAQYALGEIYENGVGMGKNMAEALLWYGKAAEQGDKKAGVKIQQQKHE